MKEIVFASHNRHKVAEVQQMMPRHIRVLSLDDIQWTDAIEEPYHTFEENAAAKATAISQKTLLPCFADDSGLIVDALDGRPGVDSAHYAGPQRNSMDNIQKVLNELGPNQNRNAHFICVIAYAIPNKDIKFFTGRVYGKIATEIHGAGGFGYDPIFIPDGFDKTFAELSIEIKNRISHRAEAMRKLFDFGF